MVDLYILYHTTAAKTKTTTTNDDKIIIKMKIIIIQTTAIIFSVRAKGIDPGKPNITEEVGCRPFVLYIYSIFLLLRSVASML